MLDYREQIQTIHNFIQRSEDEQQYPYAYEIYLITGGQETALTSRTAGVEKFNNDIEMAIEKAKQAHGTLRVDVFGGKSHNAKHLNNYNINVSGLMNPPKQPMEKAEIEAIVAEEVEKRQIQNNNGLGDIDGLLGLITGDNEHAKGKVESLFGLFNALSGNNKEVERISYQKQLDDFKFETRFNNLEEKHERLRTENAELRAEKDRYYKENKELKNEKADLENRLAGYAPNELMKRVAVGVISGIGGRLLSNSPKTAELLGLTPEELKGALGVVDEDDSEETTQIPESNVEITDMGAANTPEDKKKAAIIKNLSDALMTWDLPDVAKIANIVGLCLDKAELINKTLQYLNQAIQGVPEPDNDDLEQQ